MGEAPAASTSVPPPGAKAAVPVVVGVIVLFVGLVIVIWQTGVFDKDTSTSDAQVVAGMLTLLGGLIASAFTLVGVLLKHSIDQHSARLAEETERSRRLEARETEHRLRLETSIKAVELLTTPEGGPAPPGRQSGALFVLGSEPLEQLDLAVALLSENWRSDSISSSAAVWVIDRALNHKDENLQADAAWLLRNHADLLPRPDGSSLSWPRYANLEWPLTGHYFARTGLVTACVEALAQRGPDSWETSTVNWFIAEFETIRKAGDASEVHSAATLVLDVLLDWALRRDPEYGLMMPDGLAPLSALRAELTPQYVASAETGASQEMASLVMKLRTDWGEPQPDAEAQ